MSDISIIGAGVAGLCVANELLSRGVSIRVYDHQPLPGPHACSWWAGGMLAPFCERESAEQEVVRFGSEAIDWWDQHTGVVQRNGSLVLSTTRDRNELVRFAKRTSDYELLDAQQVSALEPDLSGHIRQALHFSGEAHLDPRKALLTLAENLNAAGVVIEQGEPSADSKVIDCRGLAAMDRLSGLRGVKGEMLVLRCPELSISRPVRFIHPRMPLYIVPRGEGIYMLGATMLETSEGNRLTVRSVLELLSAAYALHPAFAEAEIIETGVDVRPAFADNLPRIRQHNGRIYVNGLYRHGYLLSPALARMTADLVLNNHIPEAFYEDFL
ncbi:FAD-dependent oxidoreductase [Nitrincola schmidtii]|uniref:FAD-dependent oxidoreductase n=1 Tax=Nitrincola schmidtii TaxID=1730894 RepID=UPI00124DB5F7|nr:FAD-dependent oxidoreductase [Nitrincola schmidtii]